MTLDILAIFIRWVHVASACVLVGSVFFAALILPLTTRDVESSAAEQMAVRGRRGFKMIVHVTLLLFLLSGAYNAWRAWPIYTQNPGVMHGIFGVHLLLGLGAITLLFIATAGREPRRPKASLLHWALVLLLLGIAAASTLKSAREWTMTHKSPAVASNGGSHGR